MTKNYDKIRLIPKENKRTKIVPKIKLKVFILFIVITLVIIFVYAYGPYKVNFTNSELYNIQNDQLENVQTITDDTNYYDENSSSVEIIQSGTKNILFWTKFFNNPDWYTGKDEAGEEVLRSVKCPVTNCFFTHNKTLLGDLTKFDVIAFHGPEFRRVPLPNVRSSHQLYIFVSLESPTAVIDNLKQYNNFYNLTMTYRLDSDIEFDYGKVIVKKTDKVVAPSINPKWKVPDENFKDDVILKMFKRKKKSAAWFVSNCFTRSKRNKLAGRMKNLTDVDIYGRCGELKCPVDDKKCLDMLSSDYKFYLSFENSLCKDYITEKLYRPLSQYVIPVVFNGGNTSRFAPPKSYIDSNDFDTVEDLVNYMKFLSDNPEEYVKYFWWKQHYAIKSHPTFQYTLCDLCRKLNNEKFMKATHNYDDIHEWFSKEDMCNQNSHIKF